MTYIEDNDDRNWWRGLITIFVLILASLFIPYTCKGAELDTLDISGSQIIRIVEKQSASKKTTTYHVVYSYADVTDVTTISKSTYDYIQLCKEFGIEPKLGLKLKDGQITSIVRKKTKVKQKKP